MSSQPLVAIVILTWNSSKDIVDCLDSVQKLAYPNYKIIVVDNNSGDNTTNLVKKYYEVHLLELAKNYYFTGGNNRGIDYALRTFAPKYLLVLNPDTEVEPDLVSKLVEIAESDPKVGAVGPKIKFNGGKNDGKINSAGLFYDGFRMAYDLGFGEVDTRQYDHTKEVFGVTGTCILFRAEMIQQIGGFWEILRMYLDEVELFVRAKKAGWKALYTGKTTVRHKYMQSTNQAKDMNLEKLKNRNWLLIALRHYSLRGKLAMVREVISGK